jgi:holo-[acyl-carrier protein] synthase
MIIGLGTDIIEVPRIGEMIERHGELFLQRVFTEQEIHYCQQRKAALQHYAGRWAAKEAVMKTLGTGFTKGVGWTDIEVISQRSGQPIIQLAGTTAEIATKLGIDEILITISLPGLRDGDGDRGPAAASRDVRRPPAPEGGRSRLPFVVAEILPGSVPEIGHGFRPCAFWRTQLLPHGAPCSSSKV